MTRKIPEFSETNNDEVDISNVSGKVDSHNPTYEETLKKRKGSTMIAKRKKAEPVPKEIYDSIYSDIERQKNSRREELPLTNFVRDRLLKRVL